MRNKFYVIGSIFSILSALFTEFVLYLFYLVISCADSLNQSNGTDKSFEHVYVIIFVLAIALVGAIVLAIITLIKSAKKKPTPLAMIIYQLVTNFASVLFSVYVIVSSLIEGVSGDGETFMGAILMFVLAIVPFVLYILGVIKASKDKKKAIQEA